jgi:hypothetical protein
MDERRRAEHLAGLANALSAVEKAQDALRELKKRTPPSVVEEFRTVEDMSVDMQRYLDDAVSNADNVTENRSNQFLKAHPAIREDIARWCFMRGLTEFDAEAIWCKLLGHPRPIQIAKAEEREDEFEAEDFLDQL